MKINYNYLQLKDSYLFSTIAKKVAAYKAAHPDKPVISLGIGDVTLPLAPVVLDAMHAAVDEMGKKETFRGYGPDQGYDFLRGSLRDCYARRGVEFELDEIFVSDGAKSDCGNILDIFSAENEVLVPDPVYPVYVDTNVMAGRRIKYMNATAENGFLPMPDENLTADIIYLCSPNNPTGACYNRDQLKKWVDFANQHGSVILFDAAYEYFVSEDLPRSIFEIEGAKTCAIELCSFSKTAGFTGTRCGYTVVPSALVRGGVKLNRLWNRRQTTKFNGVAYIIQRGAAAVFTEEGQRQISENIGVYRRNAAKISQCMDELGLFYTGGKNSPYIFFKCPKGMKSWEFFDYLLNEEQVVGTPGSGFGENGEGFFRLTAFASEQNTEIAIEKIKRAIKKL